MKNLLCKEWFFYFTMCYAIYIRTSALAHSTMWNPVPWWWTSPTNPVDWSPNMFLSPTVTLAKSGTSTWIFCNHQHIWGGPHRVFQAYSGGEVQVLCSVTGRYHRAKSLLWCLVHLIEVVDVRWLATRATSGVAARRFSTIPVRRGRWLGKDQNLFLIVNRIIMVILTLVLGQSNMWTKS